LDANTLYVVRTAAEVLNADTGEYSLVASGALSVTTDTEVIPPDPETPPAIIDVPAQAGTVGTAFNLALASFVTPTDGDTVTYHVSGLPA